MTLYHLLSLRRLCVCVGGGFKQRWNTAIKINRVHEFSLVPMLFSSKKMNMMLICITSITDTVSYTSISGLVLPSSTTGQSNRKHTQTHTNTEPGGRTWHQQPQTIKGVKVLPFLNCSRVHKMGTKTPALPSPGQKRRDEQKERELRPPPPPLTVTKRPLSHASAGSEGFWAKKAAESTKSTHEPSSKTSTYYVTSLHSFDQWIWVSSSHTSTVFMALINISPMARKKKKNPEKRQNMWLDYRICEIMDELHFAGWYLVNRSFQLLCKISAFDGKGAFSFTPHRVFFHGYSTARFRSCLSHNQLWTFSFSFLKNKNLSLENSSRPPSVLSNEQKMWHVYPVLCNSFWVYFSSQGLVEFKRLFLNADRTKVKWIQKLLFMIWA